jgi:ribose transport system permease protein
VISLTTNKQQPATSERTGLRRSLVGRLHHVDVRQIGLPLAVLALLIFFTSRSDVFLTAPNMRNVGLQAAALALVSFGQCFVVLGAGIDLSVGSTVAMVSVVTGMVMTGNGIFLGILGGLAAALGVGLVNAFVVTRLRVVPFVATLAMLSIASGIALSLSGGTPISGLPLAFTDLARERVGGVPVPVLIAAALFLFAYVMLRFTRIGRYIYSVGGNVEAARLSGIPVNAVIATTYVMSSLFAGFGALILTSRVASGQPTLGGSLALESVAAVVLGGVSLFGGRGSVAGVAFGVAFVSILSNGLNLLNVASYTQLLVLGLALIAAVAIDQRLSGDST